MTEEVDRGLMLASKEKTPAKRAKTPTKEVPWDWPDAQDHCYIPMSECDVLVNSTHDYYRRVGQSELLDDLEHSYAIQLPKIEDVAVNILDEQPGCSFSAGLFFEAVSCQWSDCEHSAETTEDLMEHLNSHLVPGSRQCQWRNCSKKDHQYLLQRHVGTHVSWKPYTCPYCGRNFPTSERCRLHMRSKHEAEVKYKCEVCNEFFKTTSDRSHHMTRKHMKLRRPCQGCGKLYAGTTVLKRHQPKCKGRKRDKNEGF